jgi:hypothetical protein
VANAASPNTPSQAARTSSSSNAVRTLNPTIWISPTRMPKTTPKKAATAYSTAASTVITFACGCRGCTSRASNTAPSGKKMVARFTKL